MLRWCWWCWRCWWCSDGAAQHHNMHISLHVVHKLLEQQELGRATGNSVLLGACLADIFCFPVKLFLPPTFETLSVWLQDFLKSSRSVDSAPPAPGLDWYNQLWSRRVGLLDCAASESRLDFSGTNLWQLAEMISEHSVSQREKPKCCIISVYIQVVFSSRVTICHSIYWFGIFSTTQQHRERRAG